MSDKIAFTDLSLRSLDIGEYWDTKLPAFGLRVGKRASTFFLKKDNRRVTIGRFPEMSLQAARQRAFAVKGTSSAPSASSMTVREAVDLFLHVHGQNLRAGSRYQAERELHKLDALRSKKLASITTHDLVAITDKLKPAAANNLFRTTRCFFRFCQRRRLIDRSPLEHLQMPTKHIPRSRVLTDEELARIWRACEQRGVNGGHTPSLGTGKGWLSEADHQQTVRAALPASYCIIVQLLLLTGQRRGEIAALQKSWIKDNTVTIPPSVTKNGHSHTFPMGALASILAASNISKITNWAIHKKHLDRISGVTAWCLHDLRRTYATKMAELGVAPHVIEKLINHVTGTISGVAAIYNRHRYEKETREAVALFDAHMTKILK